MQGLHILTRIYLCLVLAVAALHAVAQDDVKNIVPMISAKSPAGQGIGAGILFSVSSGRVYVATARHVVFPGGSPATDIEVELRQVPGETFKARTLKSSAELDLAVLKVDVDDGLRRELAGTSKDLFRRASTLHAGDQLNKLGNPEGKAWSKTLQPDYFSETKRSRMLFQSQTTTVGHSGGVVMDKQGKIVGMVLRTLDQETEAATIEAVWDQLRAWNYKVQWEYAAATVTPKPKPEERTIRPTPQTAEKSRGAITIRYTGDPYNCNLVLSLDFDGTTVIPQGKMWVAQGVPLGEVDYTITGTIACPYQGSCPASGAGTLDLDEGELLDVLWQSTGYGNCAVELMEHY